MTDERLDYQTVGLDSLFCAHYLTIDCGQPADASVALLMHRVDQYGNNFIYNHTAKTKSPIINTQFRGVVCLHLDPALSYSEQARVISQWIADEPKLADVKLRTTLNIDEIGEAAARAFSALRPNWFKLDQHRTPELLRSLLVGALHSEPPQLRVADGVQCRADDLDCERCGDARAVSIALWHNRVRVIRSEL